MSLTGSIRALASEAKQRATSWVLAHRIRARHPTMNCHPTAIWDYAYGELDAIEIGKDVTICSMAEILVYRKSQRSKVEGRLSLGDRSVIARGAHIRAAGGHVSLGVGSGIAQYSVIVAANHKIELGSEHLYTAWDEEKCGVTIGDNVWVGASCVVLPGCTIGDNSVIAAGSVVTRDVPPGELWGGVPARKIRDIESGEADSAALA